MTAKDVIAHLHQYGALDPRECFLYIAGHAHEMKLSDGQRLIDLTDFTQFLVELSEAVKPPTRQVHTHCPRCGHIHAGDEECEMDCGGERICRCPNEVRV